MTKIKFDIGGGEIVNTWGKITHMNNHYAIQFENGSFDNCVILIGKIFVGDK